MTVCVSIAPSNVGNIFPAPCPAITVLLFQPFLFGVYFFDTFLVGLAFIVASWASVCAIFLTNKLHGFISFRLGLCILYHNLKRKSIYILHKHHCILLGNVYSIELQISAIMRVTHLFCEVIYQRVKSWVFVSICLCDKYAAIIGHFARCDPHLYPSQIKAPSAPNCVRNGVYRHSITFLLDYYTLFLFRFLWAYCTNLNNLYLLFYI